MHVPWLIMFYVGYINDKLICSYVLAGSEDELFIGCYGVDLSVVRTEFS